MPKIHSTLLSGLVLIFSLTTSLGAFIPPKSVEVTPNPHSISNAPGPSTDQANVDESFNLGRKCKVAVNGLLTIFNGRIPESQDTCYIIARGLNGEVDCAIVLNRLPKNVPSSEVQFWPFYRRSKVMRAHTNIIHLSGCERESEPDAAAAWAERLNVGRHSDKTWLEFLQNHGLNSKDWRKQCDKTEKEQLKQLTWSPSSSNTRPDVEMVQRIENYNAQATSSHGLRTDQTPQEQSHEPEPKMQAWPSPVSHTRPSWNMVQKIERYNTDLSKNQASGHAQPTPERVK